jgi:membrane protein implicated in regulation of membrane protease activity
MAAIVIRENAKATWVPGMASARAKACDMVRQAVDYAAAAVMICAVGAALLQLAVQIASFPVPVAVTGFTLIAVTLFQSLRRHRRARARHRHGSGTPHGVQR